MYKVSALSMTALAALLLDDPLSPAKKIGSKIFGVFSHARSGAGGGERDNLTDRAEEHAIPSTIFADYGAQEMPIRPTMHSIKSILRTS